MYDFKFKITRRELIFLFLAFIVAISVRLWQGNYNLIFPYDQARDALVVKQFVEQKDFPILGPVSDITGVHHGPWFYYFLIPLYYLGGYDPTLPLLGLIVLTSSAVFPLYFLAKKLFGSVFLASLSVILFVFSFEAISYARWLSNPVLAFPLMPFFLLSLWGLWNKKKGGAFFSGFFLGLLTGVQLVLAHQLLTVLFVLIRKKAKLASYGWVILGGLVGSLPLVLGELKFKLQAFRGLFSYLGHQAGKTPSTFLQPISELFYWVGYLVKNNVAGFSVATAGVVFLLLLLFIWKKQRQEKPLTKDALLLLFTAFTMYATLLLFGKPATNFFFVGAGIPLILLVSYALTKMYRRMGSIPFMIALFVVIGLQLRLYYQQTQAHAAYVQVQKGVWFSDRMEVLDALYGKIGKQTPFTVSIFATPYGIRSAWAYYFWWYQQEHETQVPLWYGFAANGYVGDQILTHTDHPASLHVTIYEPYFDIPTQFKDQFTAYQNEHTVLVEKFEVNHHIVQIRTAKNQDK